MEPRVDLTRSEPEETTTHHTTRRVLSENTPERSLIASLKFPEKREQLQEILSSSPQPHKMELKLVGNNTCAALGSEQSPPIRSGLGPKIASEIPISMTQEIVSSTEPPAKRRKHSVERVISENGNLAFRTEILVLKSRGELIDHVPLTKLRVFGPKIYESLGECRTTEDGIKVVTKDCTESPYVVRSAAHWLNTQDIQAALQVSQHVSWPKNFGIMWLNAPRIGLPDMVDALMDTLVSGVREESTRKKKEAIKVIEGYYRDLRFWSSGKMNMLWAVLVLHHRKPLVLERYNEEVRELIKSNVFRVFDAGDRSVLPKDPLSPNFQDYYIFHEHGGNPCYKTKKLP